MGHLCLSRKYGAILIGIGADSNHVIRFNIFDVFNGLRLLLADVDSHFGHDLDGMRIQTFGDYAGRVGFDLIREKVSRPALGHLASAGIRRAQKKNFELLIWHGHRPRYLYIFSFFFLEES